MGAKWIITATGLTIAIVKYLLNKWQMLNDTPPSTFNEFLFMFSFVMCVENLFDTLFAEFIFIF